MYKNMWNWIGIALFGIGIGIGIDKFDLELELTKWNWVELELTKWNWPHVWTLITISWCWMYVVVWYEKQQCISQVHYLITNNYTFSLFRIQVCTWALIGNDIPNSRYYGFPLAWGMIFTRWLYSLLLLYAELIYWSYIVKW
jgi:hypothetical protein